MRKKVPLILILIGIVIVVIGSQGEVPKELRTWTLIGDRVWESNGKNEIEARFLYKSFGRDESPDQVLLELVSGEKIWVLENSLSVEDQNFVIPPGKGWRGLGILIVLGGWFGGSIFGSKGGGGSGGVFGGFGGGGDGGGGDGGGGGGE